MASPKSPILAAAVCGQPDVARLEIAVHHALLVREGEAPRHAARYLEGLRRRERPLREQFIDAPAGHVLGDDERRRRAESLDCFLSEVEDGDEVGVRAEPPHRTSLAHDPFAADIVEAVGLDKRQRDVAVEQLVVGEVYPLLRTPSPSARCTR